MSAVAASTRIFFERARREARRYGEDPWVFLRELVQNSRDARADRVELETRIGKRNEFLICRDNGLGMDRARIENYLLRLYASTKEEEQSSIGFFGVGFWSVLLFQPAVIRLASSREGRTVAFEIRLADFRIRPLRVTLPGQGTEVVLVRPRKNLKSGGSELADRMRERLLHYAGHVKPLPDRRAFELFCNGEKLNRDFALPEFGGKRVKTGAFEGTIGFGTHPSVKIYKGGILVRGLAGLAEVIPSRKSRLPASGWGLYPVIAMNVNDLELLMDRQTVYEDPLLYRMVDYCEKEILRLHKRLVKRLFPMNLKNRVLSWFQGLRERAASLALFLPFLLLTGLLLWSRVPKILLLPAAWGDSAQLWIDRVSEDWQGAIVDPKLAHDGQWAFRHDGPDGMLFRIETLARYDVDLGLTPVILTRIHPFAPPAVASEGRITIHIGISGSVTEFLLPMPDGYGLVNNSLSKEISQAFFLWADHNEDPLIKVKRPGRLRYRVAPLREPLPPPLITLGPISHWPPEYQHLLEQVRGLPPETMVSYLQKWLADRFVYSRAPDLVHRFNRSKERWLEKALEARAGDCDVLNGILVLLLRSAGVHAELCVGLVGAGGTARSDLHAWGRYYLRGWHSFDLTLHTPSTEPRTTSRARDSSGGRDSVPVEAPGLADPERTGPGSRASGSPAQGRAGHGSGFPGAVSPGAWFLLLLPLAGLLAWRWRGRGDEPLVDEPLYMKNLFEHLFHFGGEKDPLRLQFRPIFPLLGGQRLSLYQIRRRADRGKLWGAVPGSEFCSMLAGRPAILDRSSKIVQFLEPYLPSIPWLEDFELVLGPRLCHPLLEAAEREIRKLDPHFRIYPVGGDQRLREVFLPLKKGGSGQRFLLIGENHELLRGLSKNGTDFNPFELFSMMDKLLNKTTFYLGEKDRFLARYAERLASTEPA